MYKYVLYILLTLGLVGIAGCAPDCRALDENVYRASQHLQGVIDTHDGSIYGRKKMYDAVKRIESAINARDDGCLGIGGERG